jgi:hypothetical protein
MVPLTFPTGSRIRDIAAAANLLVRVRQVVSDPPSPTTSTEAPTEVLAGKDLRDYFNHRRERNPLRERQSMNRVAGGFFHTKAVISSTIISIC